MATKQRRPFGIWDSPISPAHLAEDRRLEGALWDHDGQTLVWLEGRSGQGVLVVGRDGPDAPRDLTLPKNVRAEVGYGGGSFTVHGGSVYFVEHKTGRIYRQPITAGSPSPITPAWGKASSPVVRADGHWLAYVHDDEEGNDRLAVVDTQGSTWPQILAEGHDFYMQPRWSADGSKFAFVAWDHPNMPWDGTWLYVADVCQSQGAAPRLADRRVVAGGQEIAVFQPEFSPDGRTLYFISDETGWGRLAALDLQTGDRRWLSAEGVEHGLPAWVQDLRTYAVAPDGRWLTAARQQRGFMQLVRIDPSDGRSEVVAELAEYTELGQVAAAPRGDRVALVASSPAIPPRIVAHDFSSAQTRVVARGSTESVPVDRLSRCEALTWTTAGGEEAHGLFYPPASQRFEGIGKPPLVALIHGGPTSQVRAGWRADAQFFASRGWAVLLVNYRGSTGYGREYMLRLRGNWGSCDVEDSVSGARFLADGGRVDPQRMVIMGGSAGGFTVLQTMVTQPEVFAAGVCLYGVANQFALAADTHKFESRYTDSLIGPLPEAAALYHQRSPVFHAQHIRRPLAVFQGDIDRVVPREQSDEIVEALRRSGTPHIYHVYEGEGHGWRKRETIEHFYRAVDDFLRRWVIYR